MKKILSIFILFGFLFGFCAAPATAEELSCDDLAEVMEGMEMIAQALEKATDLSDEDSDQLGEVITALKVIARAEDSASLTRAVKEMDRIWNDDTVSWEDDLPNFRMANDSVIMNLERIIDRECE